MEAEGMLEFYHNNVDKATGKRPTPKSVLYVF